MPKTVVQINFNFDGKRREYDDAFMEAAQPIADVDGLVWKVWLWNDESRMGGGIYLFESESTAQAYLDGPIVAGLAAHDAVSDASIRVFWVCEKQTAITRGPVSNMIS